jgi:hypothetical protein
MITRIVYKSFPYDGVSGKITVKSKDFLFSNPKAQGMRICLR